MNQRLERISLARYIKWEIKKLLVRIMKIILLQDVKNIGKKGQIKEVPAGYGRNFLLAKKLAAVATPGGVAIVEKENEKKKLLLDQQLAEEKKLAEALKEKQIIIKARSKDGKLFGSITAKDIAVEIRKLKLEVSEKAIAVGHLRELGTHEVKITLNHGTIFTIKVTIE